MRPFFTLLFRRGLCSRDTPLLIHKPADMSAIREEFAQFTLDGYGQVSEEEDEDEEAGGAPLVPPQVQLPPPLSPVVSLLPAAPAAPPVALSPEPSPDAPTGRPATPSEVAALTAAAAQPSHPPAPPPQHTTTTAVALTRPSPPPRTLPCASGIAAPSPINIAELDASLRAATRSARDLQARLTASRVEAAAVWTRLLALDNPATLAATRRLVSRFEVVSRALAEAEAEVEAEGVADEAAAG